MQEMAARSITTNVPSEWQHRVARNAMLQKCHASATVARTAQNDQKKTSEPASQPKKGTVKVCATTCTRMTEQVEGKKLHAYMDVDSSELQKRDNTFTGKAQTRTRRKRIDNSDEGF
eukprot:jgi/Ulvmu1/2899/UM146_0041.1